MLLRLIFSALQGFVVGKSMTRLGRTSRYERLSQWSAEHRRLALTILVLLGLLYLAGIAFVLVVFT